MLLLVSAAISGVFLMAAASLSEYILDNYFERTDYIRRRDDASAERFQEYVAENQVSSGDFARIDYWLWKNQESSLELIDGGKIVYMDGRTELTQEEAEFDLDAEESISLYKIDFADKTLVVSITGVYDYSLYSIATIIVICLTFILFLAVFLYGMRGRIRYILMLKQEIELLEGGSLDYRISILGSDELTELAEGLDSMRKSFKKQITEAEYLSRTNQRMVTEISHDLRTPLTSVLLYSEILQNGDRLSEEQRQVYLEKIVRKIQHMRDLSDHLLDYALVPSGTAVPSSEPMTVSDALYDELSDLCGYLCEQGFTVEAEPEWRDVKILADSESISRIFNNISSNIQKYADKSSPVSVDFRYGDGSFALAFRNRTAETACANDSSGIGIRSVAAIMESLSGRCEVEEKDGYFTVTIIFKAK